MKASEQTGVRRPVSVAALLLVAVAVTLVAIRPWLMQPRVDDVDEPAVAAVVPDAIVPLPDPEPVAEPADSVPETTAEALPTVAPESIKVIVLPVRSANRDPAAESFLFNVRAAMLRALPGMGIEAIDVSAAEFAAFVPPSAGPPSDDRLVYLAVTHHYGGLNVAEIYEDSSPESPSWSVRLDVVRNVGSSSTGTSVRKYGDPRPEKAPETLGTGFAETLSQNATRESFARVPASTASLNLIDPTRSEQERLRALNLRQRGGFDSTTIAAAVDLGTGSPSAGTRRAVWSTLRRNVYDPVLAHPLSNALRYDADIGVRTEAALALGAYSGDPVAWSALEQARLNDRSPEVKLAARMSMLDYEERQAFTRESLLDRNLSPADRFAATQLGGGLLEPTLPRSFGDAAAEEALAYAEIVAGTEDPELKVRALSALQMTSLSAGLRATDSRVDPAITGVLIESARNTDDRVRRQALTALTGQYTSTRAPLAEADQLRVRVALETALREQPELAAELRIEEALRPGEATALPAAQPGLGPRLILRDIGRAPQ